MTTELPERLAQATEKALTAEDIFEPHILPQYDPQVVEILVRTANAGIPALHDVPVAERRANPEKYQPPWARDSSGWPGVTDDEVTSFDGAKVPVRIYRPQGEGHGEGPWGVHLNFHGGGFVIGSLQSEAQICKSMSDGAGVVVVDVNYRHCPEVTWNKVIEDSWSVVQWVRDSAASLKIKPDSISVGGISAGGHISIVLQHIARDKEIPLRLCMPTVGSSTDALTYKYYTDSPFPSFHEFYRGPVLPWATIKYFSEYCFPQDQLEARRAMMPDWWLDPLHKAKNWRGLCETFVRTAACDPLRDEGEAYGLKLIQTGTQVTIKRYLGCPHTFPYFSELDRKQEWDRDSIRALKQAHGV